MRKMTFPSEEIPASGESVIAAAAKSGARRTIACGVYRKIPRQRCSDRSRQTGTTNRRMYKTTRIAGITSQAARVETPSMHNATKSPLAAADQFVSARVAAGSEVCLNNIIHKNDVDQARCVTSGGDKMRGD